MSLKNNHLILTLLLIAGCKQMPQMSAPSLPGLTPYKIDIQQGNLITQEMLDKLQPGMTRNQVRFVLGTPLLVDPFRTDRWDYFYSMKKRGELLEQRQLKVFFQDDKMVRYEGDIVTDTKPGAEAVASAKPVQKPVAAPVAKPGSVTPAPSQAAAATPAVQPGIVATPVVPSAPAREAAAGSGNPQLRLAPGPGEPAKPEDLKPPAPVMATQREPESIVAPPLDAPPLPRLVILPEQPEPPSTFATTPDIPAKPVIAPVAAQPEAKPAEKPATAPGFFGRLFSRSPSQPVQPSAGLAAKPDVPATPAAAPAAPVAVVPAPALVATPAVAKPVDKPAEKPVIAKPEQKLADKPADLARLTAADHRLDAHGNMDAARVIDGRADRAHPVHEPAEILDTLGSVEDGRDEFTGHLARFAGNGAVAVSPPRHAVEGGRDELRSGGRDGRPHRITEAKWPSTKGTRSR